MTVQHTSPDRMAPDERRAALWLACLFALRMLGLFMILPVFALYAEGLEGSTPALAGLAIGIYGLSQAICQIPFGVLSDRYGRKPVIYGGLLIFAGGSVVAAMAHTIGGVLLGRALQGAGAISGAVMALAADVTREAHRLTIMAIIGMTMGVSFAIALILGPVLHRWIGVPGIFWLTGALALISLWVVRYFLPDPIDQPATNTLSEAAQFRRVCTMPALVHLNVGIFILHALLTSTFVTIPLALRDAGWPSDRHWELYLPVLVSAMLAVFPVVRWANQRPAHEQMLFQGAIILLIGAEGGLRYLHHHVLETGLLLFLFFLGFNLLEALLPARIAKAAPPEAKGAAMGLYASSQFLGAFAGGAIGGILHGLSGAEGVFLAGMIAAFVWFCAAFATPRC